MTRKKKFATLEPTGLDHTGPCSLIPSLPSVLPLRPKKTNKCHCQVFEYVRVDMYGCSLALPHLSFCGIGWVYVSLFLIGCWLSLFLVLLPGSRISFYYSENKRHGLLGHLKTRPDQTRPSPWLMDTLRFAGEERGKGGNKERKKGGLRN